MHDIKTMPLSDLKEAPYNPRTITPEALLGLTESVKRFGLVQPIVWNKKTGHVVGGHQRIKVLKNLGQKEALVVVVDLPESEEKALNVTMNNPNIAGDFTDGLESVLDDIKLDMPDVDFDGLMLGDIELPEIETGPVDGNTDPDAAPEPDAATKTLAERSVVPPFSVLDARQGYWQERKRFWLALGIQSEIGRGGHEQARS